MSCSASSVPVGDVAAKGSRSDIATSCLIILLHAGALILLIATEVTPLGMAVFALAWVILNCLWLALVRRPAVSALISLEILVALVLLSRFKFDKLWMTIDFVDVLIVDQDTSAFLLATFPALRWWILLTTLATIIVIFIAWRLDRYRVRLRTSLGGFAISAIALVAVSLSCPTGLREDFEGQSHISKFTRTGVE